MSNRGDFSKFLLEHLGQDDEDDETEANEEIKQELEATLGADKLRREMDLRAIRRNRQMSVTSEGSVKEREAVQKQVEEEKKAGTNLIGDESFACLYCSVEDGMTVMVSR